MELGNKKNTESMHVLVGQWGEVSILGSVLGSRWLSE